MVGNPSRAAVGVGRGDRLTCEVLSADEDGVEIRFPGGARAAAKGQAVVLYDGDEVVGGAWIREAWDD